MAARAACVALLACACILIADTCSLFSSQRQQHSLLPPLLRSLSPPPGALVDPAVSMWLIFISSISHPRPSTFSALFSDSIALTSFSSFSRPRPSITAQRMVSEEAVWHGRSSNNCSCTISDTTSFSKLHRAPIALFSDSIALASLSSFSVPRPFITAQRMVSEEAVRHGRSSNNCSCNISDTTSFSKLHRAPIALFSDSIALASLSSFSVPRPSITAQRMVSEEAVRHGRSSNNCSCNISDTTSFSKLHRAPIALFSDSIALASLSSFFLPRPSITVQRMVSEEAVRHGRSSNNCSCTISDTTSFFKLHRAPTALFSDSIAPTWFLSPSHPPSSSSSSSAPFFRLSAILSSCRIGSSSGQAHRCQASFAFSSSCSVG